MARRPMLEPRWRKVLRDLWLHRGRTVLVVLAIAVALAGAGTVLDAWAIVDVTTRDVYAASHPASATLRADSIGDDVLGAVRKLAEVRWARARRTVFATALGDGGGRRVMLFVLDDFRDTRIGAVKPEIGEWPPRDGVIVIERSSLEFSGAAVGRPLTLRRSRRRTARAAAWPGWHATSGWRRDGWSTSSTDSSPGPPRPCSARPRRSTSCSSRCVTRRSDRDGVRRIAWEVKRAVESAGHVVRAVDVPVPGEHIHAAQMDSLLFTQGAFGLLALLLSGCLVVNLVVAMLTGQVRQIGVMKTLGARPSQLSAMYLVVALCVGGLAAVVAIPVAAAAGTRYAALKADLLNFDITGVPVPWWAVSLQLLVALVMPVAAAALPVVRGCRVPVSTALRDFGIDASSNAGRLWRGIPGLSRPLLLSLRNAFRRRQRMRLTLVTFAVGGAVFLGARNLRAAIRDTVSALYTPLRYDLALRLVDAHAPDSIEAALGSVRGIARAEAWFGASAALPHGDGTTGNEFTVSAPPAATRLLRYAPVQGRWFRAGDADALVVSRSLQGDEPGMAVGETVTLRLDGQPAAFTIVGAVDAGPSAGAWATREALARRLHAGATRAAVVSLAPGTDEVSRAGTIQRLRADLARAGFTVASTQLVDENRRVMEDHMLMVAEFLGVMAWMMIAVGGMSLASTMGLAVVERTREVGVLRAIGARHGAIFSLVQVEGLVIAVLSWLIALPLSIPVSLVLGRAFGRIMLPVPDRWMPEATGTELWLLLTVGVAAFASAWPALRAMRLTTAEALGYE